MTEITTKYVTKREASLISGVPVTAITEGIKNGQIAFIRPNKRWCYLAIGEVERWVSGRINAPLRGKSDAK